MKYIIEDLDFIYIRVQLANGHWDNVSLAEVSDEKFVSWAEGKFGLSISDDENAKGTKWTPKQKISLLNHISKVINAPCVVMIKRTMRDKI